MSVLLPFSYGKARLGIARYFRDVLLGNGQGQLDRAVFGFPGGGFLVGTHHRTPSVSHDRHLTPPVVCVVL